MHLELPHPFTAFLLTSLAAVNALPVTTESSGGKSTYSPLPTNITNPELPHFYYEIPGTLIAMDGRVDGPDAAQLPIKLFTNVLNCGINHADAKPHAGPDSTVRGAGWANRQQGVVIQIEPYETAPAYPLPWRAVKEVLIALEHQMEKLEYKESTIGIIQLIDLPHQRQKIEIGHVSWTLLPNAGAGIMDFDACHVHGPEG